MTLVDTQLFCEGKYVSGYAGSTVPGVSHQG